MNKAEIVIVISILESIIALAEKIDPKLEDNSIVKAILKAIAALNLIGL